MRNHSFKIKQNLGKISECTVVWLKTRLTIKLKFPVPFIWARIIVRFDCFFLKYTTHNCSLQSDPHPWIRETNNWWAENKWLGHRKLRPNVYGGKKNLLFTPPYSISSRKKDSQKFTAMWLLWDTKPKALVLSPKKPRSLLYASPFFLFFLRQDPLRLF